MQTLSARADGPAPKRPKPDDEDVVSRHFAGRHALTKNMPAVGSKQGLKFCRADGELRLLGGACAEVLGGPNLAHVLRSGYELEGKAMEAMQKSEPAKVLSVHTSVGLVAPFRTDGPAAARC